MSKLKQALRYSFVVINGLLWCASLAAVGFLGYFLLAKPDLLEFLFGSLYVTYTMVVSATLAFLLGLLGYCTGIRLNRNCIKSYVGLVVILAVTELVLISLIGLRYQGGIANQRQVWNTADQTARNRIQRELSCCGYDGPQDYLSADNGTLDISCYGITDVGGVMEYTPFQTGCGGQITSSFGTVLLVLLGLGVTLVVLQLLGIVTASSILVRLQKGTKAHGTTVDSDQSEKAKPKYQIIKGPWGVD